MESFPWQSVNTGGVLAVLAVLWVQHRSLDRELLRLRDRLHELANELAKMAGMVESLNRRIDA